MGKVCSRHPFEYADNVCSKCGAPYCFDCLVYPKGPKKPPLCVNCALTAAGVRANAKNASSMSKRQIKKQAKELKRQKAADPIAAAAADGDLPDDSSLSYENIQYGYDSAYEDPGAFDPRYQQPANAEPSYAEPAYTVPAVTRREPAYTEPSRRPVAPAEFDADLAEPPAAPPPRLTRFEPPRLAIGADGDAQPERRSRLRPQPMALPDPAEPRPPAVSTSVAHPPVRKGGLPSVRPPIGSPESRSSAPKREPRVYGIPKPEPERPANEDGGDMLSWLDNLVTKKDD